YVYESAPEAYNEYVFYDNTLYFIETFISTYGVLHEVDFANRTATEVVSAFDLRFSPDGEGTYYELKGSEKWMEAWTDNGAVLLLYPATGNPKSSGPLIQYKMDLRTGKARKMYSAKASSTLVEPGKPADNLGAENAIDGDPTTAWAEGVDGSGVGESLIIYFGETIEVRDIGLIPGFAKAPMVYRGNNRVESARFEFSDGTTMTRSFNKKAEVTIFDLSNPVKADSVTITILGVYPGENWDDTCISEVVVNYWH
ncbi:MAG: discoidin domain-containing protein, partial [bacterium]|nr:discoidin domain-containing protein [bacterium]